MNWLTIPQIKRRSKTAKDALKVSYEHWNQLYTATAKELRAEYERTDKALARSDYCGLCTYHKKNQRFGYCRYCILEDFCEEDLWATANSKLIDWYDRDEGDWHTWKRACKALRDKLKELMEQE